MALLEQPGTGIVSPRAPTTEFKEFPKHMRHDGFAPAVSGEEVVHPGGFKYHMGGKPARYPDVLVHSPMDEEHHKSLGYKTQGPCSEAQFRKLVREATPRLENHVVVLYPKWVNGKLVNSAAEEAALTSAVAQGPVAAQPTVSVPAPVSTDDEIAALEARIAALKEGKDKVARLKKELADLEAAADKEEASEEEVEFYAAEREAEPEPAAPLPGDHGMVDEVAAKKKAKSDAIKAGLARRKAQKAAA